MCVCVCVCVYVVGWLVGWLFLCGGFAKWIFAKGQRTARCSRLLFLSIFSLTFHFCLFLFLMKAFLAVLFDSFCVFVVLSSSLSVSLSFCHPVFLCLCRSVIQSFCVFVVLSSSLSVSLSFCHPVIVLSCHSVIGMQLVMPGHP